MQPRGSRSLDGGVKSELIDDLLGPAGNLNYAREVRSRSRIEVDDRVVGVFKRRNARMPRINGDCAQLDSIEQGEEIPTDDSWLLFSTVGPYYLNPDARRRGLRGFLLVEALTVDSVGEPLENQRPIPDRGKDEVRDARVVTHHVPLGVFLLREENLVEVRDLELFSTAEVEGAISALFLECRQLSEQRCRFGLIVCGTRCRRSTRHFGRRLLRIRR